MTTRQRCEHACVLCGATNDLLWRYVKGEPVDEMVCEPCASKLIDAGEWDDTEPDDAHDHVLLTAAI